MVLSIIYCKKKCKIHNEHNGKCFSTDVIYTRKHCVCISVDNTILFISRECLKNIIKELKFLDHHVVHTIYWKFYSFTKFEHFPIDLTSFPRYHRYHYFNKCSYLGGMFVFVLVGSVTMLSMCVNLVNFCGASSRTAPHLI